MLPIFLLPIWSQVSLFFGSFFFLFPGSGSFSSSTTQAAGQRTSTSMCALFHLQIAPLMFSSASSSYLLFLSPYVPLSSLLPAAESVLASIWREGTTLPQPVQSPHRLEIMFLTQLCLGRDIFIFPLMPGTGYSKQLRIQSKWTHLWGPGLGAGPNRPPWATFKVQDGQQSRWPQEVERRWLRRKDPEEGKQREVRMEERGKTGALGLVRVNLGILANPPLALVPLHGCLPTPTALIKTHRGKE